MARANLRLFFYTLLVLLLAGCAGPDVAPRANQAGQRDVYVLISGGGTPLSNNYSQYLQARAFAGFLEERYPDRPRWVFFGLGNREGEAPILADVQIGRAHV